MEDLQSEVSGSSNELGGLESKTLVSTGSRPKSKLQQSCYITLLQFFRAAFSKTIAHVNQEVETEKRENKWIEEFELDARVGSYLTRSFSLAGRLDELLSQF